MKQITRIFVLMLAVCAFGYTPAAYAKGEKAEGEAQEKGEKDPREVELPTIIMPVSKDGRLVNYLFVTFRMLMGDKVNPWKIRDKAHYGRDALVRVVHKVDMTNHDNYRDFDRAKIESDIIPALEAVYGEGTIEKMWPEYLDSHKANPQAR